MSISRSPKAVATSSKSLIERVIDSLYMADVIDYMNDDVRFI